MRDGAMVDPLSGINVTRSQHTIAVVGEADAAQTSVETEDQKRSQLERRYMDRRHAPTANWSGGDRAHSATGSWTSLASRTETVDAQGAQRSPPEKGEFPPAEDECVLARKHGGRAAAIFRRVSGTEGE